MMLANVTYDVRECHMMSGNITGCHVVLEDHTGYNLTLQNACGCCRMSEDVRGKPMTRSGSRCG